VTHADRTSRGEVDPDRFSLMVTVIVGRSGAGNIYDGGRISYNRAAEYNSLLLAFTPDRFSWLLSYDAGVQPAPSRLTLNGGEPCKGTSVH
jgi:hypothetical protein